MQNDDNLQQQFAAAMQLVRLLHNFSYWHQNARRGAFLIECLQITKVLARRISEETLLQRLQSFFEEIRPTPIDKFLFVLDNHISHNYIKDSDCATKTVFCFNHIQSTKYSLPISWCTELYNNVLNQQFAFPKRLMLFA